MLENVKQSAGVIALGVIMSVIGLVWLSIAFVQALSPTTGPAMAAAAVGSILVLLPIAAVAINGVMVRAAAANKPAKQEEAPSDVMTMVAKVAEGMVGETPLLAVGFALLAGVASVSVPSAIQPLLIRLMQNPGTSDPPVQSGGENGKDSSAQKRHTA